MVGFDGVQPGTYESLGHHRLPMIGRRGLPNDKYPVIFQ